AEMPGVPSSKGCDACRKAKKKCDELQPCSRCRRLRVHCVGSGLQRFQFKHAESTAVTTPVHRTKSRAIVSTRQGPLPRISVQIPSNELAASFISTLQINDIRYCLGYYGSFLRDIPRRLGTSQALDAAVKALVASYPFFHDRDFPPEALMYHGRSLSVLRESLNDPAEARSANVLCAVYLITICQSWIGTYDDKLTSHGEAIAHLLRIANLENCKCDFQRNVIVTLSVPVILEAIVNPRIHMDPGFWEMVTAFTKQSVSPDRDTSIPRSTTTLSTLAKFPEYIRNPDPYLPEIAAAYLHLRDDSWRMREYMMQWPASQMVSYSSMSVMQQSRYQAGYTMVVSLSLILNTLLRAFDHGNAVLARESMFFCDEIPDQAELASCYRPLGAAYMALCLVVALSAVEHPQQRARVEAVMADYQTDFKEIRWRERALWLRTTFNSHRLRAGAVNGIVGTPELQQPGSCCVM
ncbi:uncharacterized protein N7459_006443, partial [Penicillium hispanicum]|uniref:uncharacterized protein n=1 Tax=Penicillium hispanicum TaxID=1080232 RepID=UPI002540923D